MACQRVDNPAREFPRAFWSDIDKTPAKHRYRCATATADDGIVRNRAKIEATIANARSCRSGVVRRPIRAGLWSFATAWPRPVDGSEIPLVSTESSAMSRELKRRGFRFVGPTTAYALMSDRWSTTISKHGCPLSDLLTGRAA